MNNNFRFYLKFISLGQDFLHEITEPVGFDVTKYVEKQNVNRYSRDISYSLDLDFYDAYGLEELEYEQVINILGNTFNHLDMGLNWILESHKRFGFESKIEFHLSNNNLFFYVGLLDCANPDTNEFDYYGCKIIQDNNVSDYKKHEDTVIDMFSTKNIKGNQITPAVTSRVLKKAVTITKESEWTTQINDSFVLVQPINIEQSLLSSQFFNAIKVIKKSEVNYTYSWFENVSKYSNNNNVWIPEIDNFKLIKANKKLSKIKITLKLKLRIQFITSNNLYVAPTRISGFFVKGNSGTFLDNFVNPNTNPNVNIFWRSDVFGDDSNIFNQIVDESFNLEISDIEIGGNLWFCFGITSGNPQPIFKVDFLNSNLKISVNETAIDTVIPMVRYIDMIKQCSKKINDTPIVAPKFDIGGEFYNQFCFNRSLISQRIDKPFNTKFKEILCSVIEVNGDYEIDKDKIFVGQYFDFYENFENAVFQIIPNKEAKASFNKRFSLNIFKFLYKTFDQNRNSKNTTEAIHTSAEYTIPNNGVENKKEISCELVRDPYSQQAVIDLEIKTPHTSDENDDKVYINDVVDLPRGTIGELKAFLGVRSLNGRYQILNREIEQEEEQSAINWLGLGFSVGNGININGIDFTIYSITRTVLELNTTTGLLDANYFLSIYWFYENVLYKSKSNEDFLEIVGVSNPTTYQGLNFSIRRNIKHFESLLNTACNYVRDGIIRNNYFKNSPELGTRLNTESTILYEKSDLIVSELADRILTPKIYKLEVYASWLDYINYKISRKLKRGFVRCYWIDGRVIKGFPQDVEYTFRTGQLELTLEEKFETDLLKLTYISGILKVNDLIYELLGNANWWRMTNEHLQLFDANSVAICNPYCYNFVELNGIIYLSKNDLLNALNLLVL